MKLTDRIMGHNPTNALLVLNFVFITSYAILGPHALFLHTMEDGGKKWVFLGMSLFATTQDRRC